MTDIPDWAIKMALNRCDIDPAETSFSDWRDATYAKAVSHLARMIAKHEQPPVDPDEEAVKRILRAFFNVANKPFNPKQVANAVSQYKQEKANG